MMQPDKQERPAFSGLWQLACNSIHSESHEDFKLTSLDNGESFSRIFPNIPIKTWFQDMPSNTGDVNTLNRIVNQDRLGSLADLGELQCGQDEWYYPLRQ